MIIVVNMILTEKTITYVEALGQNTYSKRYTTISIYVFYATFFNTAFVIQLANSYFGEEYGILHKVFNAQFNDYSYDWYGNVGN